MKRRIFACLLFVLISVGILSAKQIKLSEAYVKAGDVADINLYGTIGLANVTIQCEDSLDEYYLCLGTSHRFVLTKNDLSTLQNTMKKALDWKKVSISNNVSIEKEIPNSNLSLELQIWDSEGSSWKKHEKTINLSFVFKANPKETNWLIGDYSYYGVCFDDPDPEYPLKPISVRDMKFSNYEYKECDESTLTDFSKAIDKNTLDAAIRQAKKQDNASDLFN